MNLSKSNLFGRFYNWMYGEYPPDVCTFFWTMVYTVLFSIVVIPGRALCNLDKQCWEFEKYSAGKHFTYGFTTLMLNLLCVAVGNMVIRLFGYEFVHVGIFLLGIPLGALVIAIMIGLVALIIAGIQWYGEYKREKRREAIMIGAYRYKPSFRDNLSDWIGAIRQKHCTKLNWKD
jgi:hypothetical protein